MKNKSLFSLTALLCFFLFKELYGLNLPDSSKRTAAYYSGIYVNLFNNLLNKNQSQVTSKINAAFNQLFYGDEKTQRIYYPVDFNMAYIKDIIHNDVRTEGMSYGMMITVQLNKKKEFDRLWKWAKSNMQFNKGQHKGFFAWHCETNGFVIDSNSASDGEEWIVMSLFFASARWGNGEGIFDYNAEAQNILNAMLNKKDSSDRENVVTNMFNKEEKMVVFVPAGAADDFTDPSYHVPHFYELWGRWAESNNKFWCDAASASRQFLRKAANRYTGLTPDYALFDGSPYSFRGGGHQNFQYDAWRVAMNIAVDYQWFAEDEWQVKQSNRLLDFFYSQGIEDYGNLFTLDGEQLSDIHSTGLVAMNAVASIASTNTNRKDFVEALWNAEIPSGEGRYYDGLLYMLALLQVSGNFRIYSPTEDVPFDCYDFN